MSHGNASGQIRRMQRSDRFWGWVPILAVVVPLGVMFVVLAVTR